MKDQHLQNSWNSCTLKNQLYTIFSKVNVFVYIKPATCILIYGVFLLGG